MSSKYEDTSPLSVFDPTAIHQLFLGLEVPDPITFIVSPKYLNRPNLYPRQATLMKVFFLREDLFTAYDYQVVAEWDESYRTAKSANEPPNSPTTPKPPSRPRSTAS